MWLKVGALSDLCGLQLQQEITCHHGRTLICSDNKYNCDWKSWHTSWGDKIPRIFHLRTHWNLQISHYQWMIWLVVIQLNSQSFSSLSGSLCLYLRPYCASSCFTKCGSCIRTKLVHPCWNYSFLTGVYPIFLLVCDSSDAEDLVSSISWREFWIGSLGCNIFATELSNCLLWVLAPRILLYVGVGWVVYLGLWSVCSCFTLVGK
jgi:hypothetical protein